MTETTIKTHLSPEKRICVCFVVVVVHTTEKAHAWIWLDSDAQEHPKD